MSTTTKQGKGRSKCRK